MFCLCRNLTGFKLHRRTLRRRKNACACNFPLRQSRTSGYLRTTFTMLWHKATLDCTCTQGSPRCTTGLFCDCLRKVFGYCEPANNMISTWVKRCFVDGCLSIKQTQSGCAERPCNDKAWNQAYPCSCISHLYRCLVGSIRQQSSAC